MSALELYNFILKFIKNPNLHDSQQAKAAYPALKKLAAAKNIDAQFYLAELHNNPVLSRLYSPQVANYWYNQARINGHPAVKFKRFAENNDAKDNKTANSAEANIKYVFSDDPCFTADHKWIAGRRHSFFVSLNHDTSKPRPTYDFKSVLGSGGNGSGRAFSSKDNGLEDIFVKTPYEPTYAFDDLKNEEVINKKVYTGHVQLIGDKKRCRLITPVFGDYGLNSKLHKAKDDTTKLRLLIATAKEITRLHQLGIVHWDIKASNFRVSKHGTVYAIDLEKSQPIDTVQETYQTEYMKEMKTNKQLKSPGMSAQEIEAYCKSAQVQQQISKRLGRKSQLSFHIPPETFFGDSYVILPKHDVFAFASMILRYFPNQIHYPSLNNKVVQCFNDEPSERPTIEELWVALDETLTLGQQQRSQRAFTI